MKAFLFTALRRGGAFLPTFWLASTLFGASIEGVVKDPSGAVVPGARVTLTAVNGSPLESTRTSADGAYRFLQVPGGEFLIEASNGELSLPAPARLRLNEGEHRELELRLEITALVSQVNVTGSGIAETSSETAKSVYTIDAEQLEARAEFQLGEALRNVPGLRVRQLGGPGQLVTLHSRGLRSYDNAILLDGFRLRDPASPQGDASGFLSDLLLLDASQVEILRGSGSSLYGTHAMGSVVNVVSHPGGGPLHGSLTAEAGSMGQLRSFAQVAGGAVQGRVNYSLGVGHVNVLNGVDGYDPSRNTGGHGSLQWRPGTGSRLWGRIYTADSFLMLNSNPFVPAEASLAPTGAVAARPLPKDQLQQLEAGKPWQLGTANFVPGANDPDSRRASRIFAGMAAYEQRITSAGNFRLSYQSFLNRRQLNDGPAGISYQPSFNTSDRYEGRIDNLEARGSFDLSPAHLLLFGYEFERERFTNRSSDQNPVAEMRTQALARLTQNAHSVYAASRNRLFQDRLLVSLSARMQHYEPGQPEFEGGLVKPYQGAPDPNPAAAYIGDASVAWMLRPGTKLRVHAGNAYRAPSLYERYGASFFLGAFSPLGDPRLRPERSVSFDGGIDHYFAGGAVRAGATWFYTRLQEVIEFDFSGAILPDTDPYGRWGGYRNTGGGLARGAELTLEASPHRAVRISGSYTFTNSDLRRPVAADGDRRALGVSGHLFTALALWRVRKDFDLTFDLAAASEYSYAMYTASGSRTFLFEAPVKADIMAAYTIPAGDRWQVRLYNRVENLFNRVTYENGFRTPGICATGGVKFLF